jgi:hypothetical protein
MCKAFEQDYEGTWARLAKENLYWKKPFTKILDESKAPFYEWFADGKTNASYNCLDRHLQAGLGDKTAIIFESDAGEVNSITYAQLHARVCQFANGLKSIGVKKGDRVVLYMAMSIEGIVAMQACARIGATHSVVFGGFSAKSLEERIVDVGATVVITADEQMRGGKKLPLKAVVDEALALGADASFVGRTMDRDPKHMQATITRAEQHQGTSFLEIYQNCNIFNDGAFEIFTEKSTKQVHGLFVEQGKQLTFGANGEKGIRFDGMRPEVVEIGDKYSADDMWIHDEKDFYKAQILTRLFDNPSEEGAVFPRPFGIFYTNDRPCYEDMMALQIEEAMTSKGPGDLDKLIRGKEVWEIK